MSHHLHQDCFFCGDGNQNGLQLKFVPAVGGGVTGEFAGHKDLRGYRGYLHGGIIAGLLDSAMTNCLLRRNLCAMTAELKVRYKKRVPADVTVTVHATVSSERPPLYCLSAELSNQGEILASAEAKFMLTSVPAENIRQDQSGGVLC